jgi:hypothetical protein
MRSYLESQQRRCARCGTVQLVKFMVWQHGWLLCTDKNGGHNCADKRLTGSNTDNRIIAAKAVQAWGDSMEGQPDRKLTDPNTTGPSEDITF